MNIKRMCKSRATNIPLLQNRSSSYSKYFSIYERFRIQELHSTPLGKQLKAHHNNKYKFYDRENV